MSLRRLGVLAAVLLAVGGYYYLAEVRGADERTRRAAEAKQLFHFDVADVRGLVLRRADTTIQLVQRDGTWHVTAPVQERADGGTVAGVLRELAPLTPARTLDDPEGLAEYGLAPPALTMEVLGEGDAALATLQVGDANPDNTRRFLRAGDSPIVGLVPLATYDRLNKSLFDLRSKQWTTLGAADVQAIHVVGPDIPETRVERDEQEQWRVYAPTAKPADAAKVRALINSLLNARIAQVVAETAEDWGTYGLDAGSDAVRFTTGGAETELRFGDAVPDATPAQRYARLAGDARVLAFPGGVADSLPAGPEALRERKLLAFAHDAVDKIVLRQATDTVTLTRTTPGDGTWILDGPEAARADTTEVGALLGRLGRLEALRFLRVDEEPVTPADFDAAPVAVELWPAGAAAPLRVRFAQGEATQGWYALRAGDLEVYPVSDDAATGLRLTRADLADKHLLRFDRSAVHRIDVRLGERAVGYARRSDATWRGDPGAPPVTAEQMEQFLQDLTDAQYVTRLPEDDASLSGASAFAVTLGSVLGEPVASLRVGRQRSDAEGATLYAVDADGVTATMDGRLLADWSPVFGGAE